MSKTITIIGSMRHLKEFEILKEKLNNKGFKVILPRTDNHYKTKSNIKKLAMIDFNKDLTKSNAILVANFNKKSKKNYIGTNTLMEIGMAFNRKKKVFILNKFPTSMKDELNAINAIVLNRNINKIKF